MKVALLLLLLSSPLLAQRGDLVSFTSILTLTTGSVAAARSMEFPCPSTLPSSLPPIDDPETLRILRQSTCVPLASNQVILKGGRAVWEDFEVCLNDRDHCVPILGAFK